MTLFQDTRSVVVKNSIWFWQTENRLEDDCISFQQRAKTKPVSLKEDCKTWTVLLSNAMVVCSARSHFRWPHSKTAKTYFLWRYGRLSPWFPGPRWNNTELGTENLLEVPRGHLFLFNVHSMYAKRMKDIKRTFRGWNLRKCLTSFTTVLSMAFNTLY